MPFVPEWAPNVHPLLVHFPIALSFVAALADAGALLSRRRALRQGAVGLYALAALGALAAFLTGRQAVDTIEPPPHAVSTLNAHADLALYTVWALGLYALLRIGLEAWDRRNRLAVHLPVALLGLGGVLLVWQTAEHGAALVFAHGVGVQATASGDVSHAPSVAPEAPGVVLTMTPVGGWSWQPTPGQRLPSDVSVLEGDRAAIHPLPAGSDSLFAFHLASGPLMLVAGEPVTGVQIETVLDLSGFDGTVALIHHVQDAVHYDFLAFDGARVVQGRRSGDRELVFEQAPVTLPGVVRLRATAQGTHFYGYVDGRSVVHGHGDAPETGRAGLRFEGSGTVRLGSLILTPIE